MGEWEDDGKGKALETKNVKPVLARVSKFRKVSFVELF